MLLGPEACLLCGATGTPACPACLDAVRAPALPPPHQVDACRALVDYHLARPLVTRLKNGQRRSLVTPLAAALAAAVAPSPGAVVTWAPTTPERARARGFDQAELLARALARRWRRPVQPLLRRVPGTAQMGRGRPARHRAPAFEALRSAPAAVVLVDDVVTTGATLAAAARALRAAGARTVEAAVLAQAERAPAARP
ncbi:MAG TPA: phosphoribosyltransferase family protein [Acidimicrobiales bacterium]|nr:phosphoribosyltransferase family protein [Acidimicrobiales bacterium]